VERATRCCFEQMVQSLLGKTATVLKQSFKESIWIQRRWRPYIEASDQLVSFTLLPQGMIPITTYIRCSVSPSAVLDMFDEEKHPNALIEIQVSDLHSVGGLFSC
jgi:hypothetical protein